MLICYLQMLDTPEEKIRLLMVRNIVRGGFSSGRFFGKAAERTLRRRDEEEANILIWTDEKERAIFCLRSPLGETELIKMAESVEAVPAAWHPDWLSEGYEVFDESSGITAPLAGGELVKTARSVGKTQPAGRHFFT